MIQRSLRYLPTTMHTKKKATSDPEISFVRKTRDTDRPTQQEPGSASNPNRGGPPANRIAV